MDIRNICKIAGVFFWTNINLSEKFLVDKWGNYFVSVGKSKPQGNITE